VHGDGGIAGTIGRLAVIDREEREAVAAVEVDAAAGDLRVGKLHLENYGERRKLRLKEREDASAIATGAESGGDGEMLHIAEEAEMPVCDEGNAAVAIAHQRVVEVRFAVRIAAPHSDITPLLRREGVGKQPLRKGVVGTAGVGDAS
jgi:16S rRNA C1402 (ribose-2'-O) methylase RsmI